MGRRRACRSPSPHLAPLTIVALSPRALPRSRHRRWVDTAEVEALAVGGSSEKASKSNASEASHQGKGVGHQAGQGRLPGHRQPPKRGRRQAAGHQAMERLRLRSNPTDAKAQQLGFQSSVRRRAKNSGRAWEPLRACGHTLAARGRARDHTRRRAGRGAWCGLGARWPPSSPSWTPSPLPRLSIPVVRSRSRSVLSPSLPVAPKFVHLGCS